MLRLNQHTHKSSRGQDPHVERSEGFPFSVGGSPIGNEWALVEPPSFQIQWSTEVPLRRGARSVCPCGDPWGTPLQLEIKHSWAPAKPPRGQALRSPRPKVNSVLTRQILTLRIGRTATLRTKILEFTLFEGLPEYCGKGTVRQGCYKEAPIDAFDNLTVLWKRAKP